jgi:hypothetical protein
MGGRQPIGPDVDLVALPEPIECGAGQLPGDEAARHRALHCRLPGRQALSPADQVSPADEVSPADHALSPAIQALSPADQALSPATYALSAATARRRAARVDIDGNATSAMTEPAAANAAAIANDSTNPLVRAACIPTE